MANIELPKDAEGREISLDTKTLYDDNGALRKVIKFIVYPYKNVGWNVCLENGFDDEMYDPNFLHLTPPESWERLEEDLRRASERNAVTSYCRYFNTTNRCVNCSIHNDDGCCTHKDERAFGDILDRIRKLRCEDDA